MAQTQRGVCAYVDIDVCENFGVGASLVCERHVLHFHMSRILLVAVIIIRWFRWLLSYRRIEATKPEDVVGGVPSFGHASGVREERSGSLNIINGYSIVEIQSWSTNLA